MERLVYLKDEYDCREFKSKKSKEKVCEKLYYFELLMESYGFKNLKELEDALNERNFLKTRVVELEDKDWYESTIEQLEEQNGKLIKEREDLIRALGKKIVEENKEAFEVLGDWEKYVKD